jgi:hypothetical protein
MVTLRRSMVMLGLALISLVGPLHAVQPEQGLDAPQGLTLQAKTGGRYLLLWDPVDSDSLMGYSVWLRRKGEKEFVRLTVPVKVGKEIQKQPMVSEAKLELKLGEVHKDLEFSVVAEYEDGPSVRSASVFSSKARDLVAVAAGSAAAPQRVSPPAEVQAKVDPYATEDARPKPPQDEAPWDDRSALSTRSLLQAPKTWRTALGASFEVNRFMSKGKDPFSYTRLLLSGSPYQQDQVVTWKRTDVRTRLRVPLTLKVGLFEGLEGWAEVAYHAEDVSIGEYSIDGTNYDYIRFVNFRADGSLFYLSNPTSAGFGDSQAGLRLQPLPSVPLVLGAQVTVPTGVSRLRAMFDREAGRDSPAGTGDGVVRMGLRVDYGWRGLRPGLSAFGEYSLGVTEAFNETSGAVVDKVVLNRGNVARAGVGITIPWNVLRRDGAVVLEAIGRSEDASRYTIDGIDRAPYYSKIDRPFLQAQTGIQFYRDDSLELAVDAMQTLPGGFETGGRLSYRSGLLGDQLAVSGRLVY